MDEKLPVSRETLLTALIALNAELLRNKRAQAVETSTAMAADRIDVMKRLEDALDEVKEALQSF